MKNPTTPEPRERRSFAVSIRMDGMGEGERPIMRGHAAVFNSPSETMRAGDSLFREVILPGAFSDALAKSDCRALFNHNPDNILGRSSAGTLRMLEDETGLAIEIDPPDTMCSRDLQVSMQRGDIREMSFGFSVAKGGDKWARNEDGTYTRTISAIDRLYDVSPVTYPAYPETDCALRSLVQATEETVPTFNENEIRRMRVDIEAVEGSELRVNMGWCGTNTVGTCTMCNLTDCLCTGCQNAANCNMQTTANGGACTKCMQPGCLCLTCANTNECKLMKMYDM